jgi:hypothetical protein
MAHCGKSLVEKRPPIVPAQSLGAGKPRRRMLALIATFIRRNDLGFRAAVKQFSYVDLERRASWDHRLRAIRRPADAALAADGARPTRRQGVSQGTGHGSEALLHRARPGGERRHALAGRRFARDHAGADKGYGAAGFIEELRTLNVRPHVAQNTSGRRSAIDWRTTSHRSYGASQRIRKRIEEAFG